MPKLYELLPAYEEAMECDNEEERIARLNSFEIQAIKKIDSIAKFSRNLETDISAVESEIERLEGLKKSLKNKKEWLNNYLKGFMEQGDLLKIKTDLFQVSLINNPPAIEIINEELVPDKYKTKIETIKIDKIKMKEDLKNAIVPFIEGAELRQSRRLVIK